MAEVKDFGYAQICLNGHIITYKSNELKVLQNFCARCGQRVIIECENCQTPIRGGSRYESHIDPPYRYYSNPYKRPGYCYECSHAFPWTKAAEESAFELIEFSTELNDAEKKDLQSSIQYLLIDSPKTNVSVAKFKSYASKAGTEIAKGLREILIDIVSETVKKSIWS